MRLSDRVFYPCDLVGVPVRGNHERLLHAIIDHSHVDARVNTDHTDIETMVSLFVAPEHSSVIALCPCMGLMVVRSLLGCLGTIAGKYDPQDEKNDSDYDNDWEVVVQNALEVFQGL